MSRSLELLLMWRERLFLASTAHYRASEAYERKARFFTKLNMLFAISVLFFANNKLLHAINIHALDIDGDLIISLAGLGTVLTAALQYINRYEERAAQHKLAASEFSNLKRKIERYLASEKIEDYTIHTLSRECNYLSKNCPLIERTYWNVIVETVAKHKKTEEAVFKFDVPLGGENLKSSGTN